jgi:hypothetical protein
VKPTPLTKYRIPAYSIAEMSWGSGGTHAYRCNRRGAYYYSCSGHGGYVVDSRCLTRKERAKIERHIKPIDLRLLVQRRNGNGHRFVIGVSMLNVPRSGCRLRSQSFFNYSPRLGPIEWVDLPVYLFEEDCDWAVLEKLTDIRAEHPHLTERQRRHYINETFNQWHRNKN